MKQGAFYYNIDVFLTFTAREILALYGASQDHYDSKCKAAGRPRLPGAVHGGEIWGLINRLMTGITHHIEGESRDDYVKRLCSANPEATITTNLSTETLGTLGKIAEMLGENKEEDILLFKIKIGIKQALQSANAEYSRLNIKDDLDEPEADTPSSP